MIETKEALLGRFIKAELVEGGRLWQEGWICEKVSEEVLVSIFEITDKNPRRKIKVIAHLAQKVLGVRITIEIYGPVGKGSCEFTLTKPGVNYNKLYKKLELSLWNDYYCEDMPSLKKWKKGIDGFRWKWEW